MTILSKNCYNELGLTPKYETTNKIINTIRTNQKNLYRGNVFSQNCLDALGVKQRPTVKIQKKIKIIPTLEHKNTFLDFLYFYRYYYLKNNIEFLDENSLKIQIIDTEEELLIPIENDLFQYNESVYIITTREILELPKKQKSKGKGEKGGKGEKNTTTLNLGTPVFLGSSTTSTTTSASTSSSPTNVKEQQQKKDIIEKPYIEFLYNGNLISLDETLKVVSINKRPVYGIPKQIVNHDYIPIISSFNLPSKILKSIGLEDPRNNFIPLYFNILNERFFIHFWRTNLYIDGKNFFILGKDKKPFYFNHNLEYIETPTLKQEIMIKYNILNNLYQYPYRDIENTIRVARDNTSITFQYQDDVSTYQLINGRTGLISPEDKRITLTKEGDNLSISFSPTENFRIDKGDCKVLPGDITLQNNDVIFIKGYNNYLKISKTLSYFINIQDKNNIPLFYDILSDLFFMNFMGMNLYFEKNTDNYVVIQNKNAYILNKDLNYIDYKEEYYTPINESISQIEENINIGLSSTKNQNIRQNIPLSITSMTPTRHETGSNINPIITPETVLYHTSPKKRNKPKAYRNILSELGNKTPEKEKLNLGVN